MTFNLSGRTVLVGGGTGGLGNAVSLAFLEEGARVVVSYRKEEEYAALKRLPTPRERHWKDLSSMLPTNVQLQNLLPASSLDMAGWMP
jgi:NAD(P)-dependent dehydrogenase (short-subunit alcohol dehydrogenase family)